MTAWKLRHREIKKLPPNHTVVKWRSWDLNPRSLPPGPIRLHWRHMEVPRLGIKSEPQLQAYTTATATPHPSLASDLPHTQLKATLDP